MRLFPLNKHTAPLLLVAVVAIGFFIGGLFEVLDYFIIKVLMFMAYGALLILGIGYALLNDKKKRLEDTPQDDSY